MVPQSVRLAVLGVASLGLLALLVWNGCLEAALVQIAATPSPAPSPPPPVADPVVATIQASLPGLGKTWRPAPRETTVETPPSGGTRVRKVIHQEAGPLDEDTSLHLPTVELGHPGELGKARGTSVTTQVWLPAAATEALLGVTPMPSTCLDAVLAGEHTMCGQQVGGGVELYAGDGGRRLTVVWSTRPPDWTTVVHTIGEHETVGEWTYPEGASEPPR